MGEPNDINDKGDIMSSTNNDDTSVGYTEQEIENLLNDMIVRGQILQLNVSGEQIIMLPKVISDAKSTIFQEIINLSCLLTVDDIFNQKNIKDYMEKAGFGKEPNIFLEVLRTSVENLVFEGKLRKISRNKLIYYHYSGLDRLGLKTLKELE